MFHNDPVFTAANGRFCLRDRVHTEHPGHEKPGVICRVIQFEMMRSDCSRRRGAPRQQRVNHQSTLDISPEQQSVRLDVGNDSRVRARVSSLLPLDYCAAHSSPVFVP